MEIPLKRREFALQAFSSQKKNSDEKKTGKVEQLVFLALNCTTLRTLVVHSLITTNIY